MTHFFKCILIVLLLVCGLSSVPEPTRGQVIQYQLNLSFERQDEDHTPSNWMLDGNGYSLLLDSSMVREGHYSLHMVSSYLPQQPRDSSAYATSSLLIAEIRGKE